MVVVVSKLPKTKSTMTHVFCRTQARAAGIVFWIVAVPLLLLILCDDQHSLQVHGWQPPPHPVRLPRVATSSLCFALKYRRYLGSQPDERRCRSATSTRVFSSTDDVEVDASSSSTVETKVKSATKNVAAIPTTTLDVKQQDFVMGYLNKHHADVLLSFAMAFTELGSEMAAANVWSGGSYTMESARLVAIDGSMDENNEWTLTLDVTIQRRGQPNTELKTVQFPVTAIPIKERARYYDGPYVATVVPPRNVELDTTIRRPIDDLIRKLCRLCAIVQHPDVTGKLIQLAFQLGGAGIGELPENMYLNQVPHNRYVRQWFYDKAATAIHDAVLLASRKQISNRQQIVTLFPETNPSMDSYRIGTLLELIRTAAIKLAEENVRVRICVQKSMGVGIFTGVPKQLNGVARLLQAMDWQSDIGEENEGMIGDYVRFGAVGADHVLNEVRDAETGVISQHQDDVFIILAPQNMVGTDTSIIPLLQQMVDAAGDRPVILVNADLTDKVSAAGQQSVRGRQARLDFAASFETIFHFQNIYVSGTSYFPILGSITKLHPEEPWIAHQRRDFADNGGEIYVPVLAGERMPEGEAILQSFAK